MSRTVPVFAVAALGLAACDVPQQTPETTALAARAAVRLEPIRELFGARSATDEMRTGSAAVPESGGDERSIRLFGPGVSRERQTGV
jgi:hypothetical protein